MAHMAPHKVVLHGHELSYVDSGSGPVVLFIHGILGSQRQWAHLVDKMDDDHRVLVPDLFGHGESAKPLGDYSLSAHAAAMRDLLDHLGIARATVIGCSRGGGIAIDLAAESPDRVNGLVTVGAGPSGFTDVELTDLEDARFDELDAAFDAQDWHRLARREVTLWAFGPLRNEADLDPEFVATAYALGRVNAAHAEESPTPIPLEPPAFNQVSDIEVPALVTVGEFDLTPHLAEYEYLLSTLPDVTGATFRDTAHLPSVERSADFQRVLVDWLAVHRL